MKKHEKTVRKQDSLIYLNVLIVAFINIIFLLLIKLRILMLFNSGFLITVNIK